MSPEWTGNLNFGIRFQSVVNFPCFSLCSRRFRQHASERGSREKIVNAIPDSSRGILARSRTYYPAKPPDTSANFATLTEKQSNLSSQSQCSFTVKLANHVKKNEMQAAGAKRRKTFVYLS